MDSSKRLEILERTEICMREISDATSYYSGDLYLNSLVCILSKVLKASYVFIAIPKSENRTFFKTVSLSSEGNLLANIEYDNRGTPCEKVHGKYTCCFNENVAELFPEEQLLKEMNIEAYIGVPLYSDKVSEIGVLACLFQEPLSEDNSISTILDIFAHRAASEIQRLNTIDDLLKLNKEYLDLNEQYKIQNEKLEFALEQAKGEERLRSAFLQNISHEIRTPMNGILGFSDLISNNGITLEESQKYSQYVSSSCNQLLSVVNDILCFSRIESQQVVVKEDVFSLNGMLIDLYKVFLEKAKAKGIEFTYHFRLLNRDSFITTDKMKLKQILWNLITNAIKFTSKGYVHFTYEIKGNSIEFMVKDSGIGISDDKQESIFKAFHQVDSSSQRRFAGVGLGLSICSGCVKQLGGKIWIRSKLNAGTSLFFTIPYHRKNASHIK